MKKICIIHNPDSGFFNQREKIESALKKYELEVEFINLNKSLSNNIERIREEGCNVFVAAGGDGTVNAVAGIIYNSKSSLGIIPLGTYNHLAKDLKLPIDIDAAVSVIAKTKIKKIDIAKVNDQIFLNTSSIGIYARMAFTKKRSKVWLFRWLLGAFSSIRFLLNPPKYNLQLNIGAKKITRSTPIVFIGNNKYDLTSLGLYNRRSLSSGRLCIYLAKTHNPLRLLMIIFGIIIGRVNSTYFEEFHTQNITISSKRRKLLVAYDGEVSNQVTPLEFSICTAALNVITV